MNENKEEFIEFKDYYLEEGRIHFTKEYLLKNREQCCGSLCRHCPYDKSEKGNTTLRTSE
jgi:hypothetical protein